MRRVLLLVLVAAAFAPSSADAGQVMLRFSGVADSDYAAGGWSAGDSFTSTLTLEDSTAGQFNSFNGSTQYLQAGTDFDFTIGGKAYESSSFYVAVYNDSPIGSQTLDRVIITTASHVSQDPLQFGKIVDFIQFDMYSFSSEGNPLADVSLNASAWTDFARNAGRFVIRPTNDQPRFTVTEISLGSAQAVPEPTSLALVGLGGIGMFGGWYRKRRKILAMAV